MPVEGGVVLGAFGCNYEGELSTELILQRVQSVLDEAEMAGFRLKGIKLTDAMGWATPQSVERLIGAVRSKWPELEIALHLHDTRGTGMASAYAGLRLGVPKFDASIAGLGGCPFAATDGAAGHPRPADFALPCEEWGGAHSPHPYPTYPGSPPRREVVGWRRAGSRLDDWPGAACLVLAFFLKPNTFFDCAAGQTDLMLRRPRSGRLEAWRQRDWCPPFETALRAF